MKYFIASDIHGSYYYGKMVVDKFIASKADKLILLGDILYHGPRNDLPKDYRPKELTKLLNEYRKDIICVQGNCDADVDQMVLQFPILAPYLIMEVNGINVYFTHGHVFNNDNLPPLNSDDILVHGHTHVQRKEFYPTHTYLNPGSISLPKEDSYHGYMILDNDTFYWYDENDLCHDSLKVTKERE